jgi:hypothetical protein
MPQYLSATYLAQPFVIVNFVTWTLCIVSFSIGMHFCSRLLRGKGTFENTLSAMLFSSAYLPFFALLNYIEWTNPEAVNFVKSSPFSISELPTMFSPLYLLLISIIESIVIFYIVIKLAPVVGMVHSFGRFRSLLAVAVNGLLFLAIYYFALLPVGLAFYRD